MCLFLGFVPLFFVFALLFFDSAKLFFGFAFLFVGFAALVFLCASPFLGSGRGDVFWLRVAIPGIRCPAPPPTPIKTTAGGDATGHATSKRHAPTRQRQNGTASEEFYPGIAHSLDTYSNNGQIIATLAPAVAK